MVGKAASDPSQEVSVFKFFTILSIIGAVFTGFKLFKATMSDTRGTNAVTRFVRNVGAYGRYKACLLSSVIQVVLFLLIGLACHNFIVVICPAIMVVLTMLLMYKSSHSKRRVKDARYVTKQSLDVGGQVAGDAAYVGTAIATHGNLAAAKATKAIGDSAGGVMRQASAAMTDVEATPITVSPIDAEALVAAANRMGINTEGKTIEQISDKIVKFAPTAAIAALPEDLSNVEKAKRIVANDV